MNKQLLLILLIVLSVLLSVGSVCASELNVTDSYSASLADDTSDVSAYDSVSSSDASVSDGSNVGNDSSKISLSSEEVLESDNSNTLSTNMNVNDYSVNALLGASSNTPTFTVKSSTTSFGYGAGSSFKVALTLDDSPLVGKLVTFKVGSKSYSYNTDANGVAALPINFAVGTYTVSYSYAGDSKISGKTGSTKITVKERYNTKITWKSPTSFKDDSKTFKVLVTDANNAALANRIVKLTIDSKTYSNTTDSKGYATFNLKLNLDAKNYTVAYSYAGNNWYKNCSGSTKISVVNTPTFTVKSDTTSFGYGAGTSFKVALTLDGTPLADKEVTFKVNKNTYAKKTNANGVAALPINFAVGTYTISYSYAGDSKISAKTGSTKITVKERYTTKITWKSPTSFRGDSQTFKVLVTDANNAALANRIVKLTIDSKTYSNTTDSKGYATFNLKLNLDAKNYTVTYSYAGNNWYKNCSGSTKISVVNTPTFTVKSGTTSFGYGAGTSFKVALTLDDSPLVGKLVTFNVGSKSYSYNTDAKGVAALPINFAVGTYTISYSYAGDSKISGKTGSTKITVKERYNTKITWKSPTSFKDDSQTFKVLVTDANNAALANRIVKLTIDSKTYSNTTDSKGYATFNLKLNLDAKNYTVAYSYAGNNWYKPSDKNQVITVTKSVPSGPSTISINDIIAGANTIKTYYENHGSLPSTVTAANYAFTMPEFLYLMNQAIYQLGNSNTNAIKCIYGVKDPSSPSGDTINAQLTKANYLNVAKTVADYIKNNNQAPNSAFSAVGAICYTELVDASARILVFYKNNENYMPNYVTIKYTDTSSGVSVSINDILSGASRLKQYYDNYNALPSTVTAGSYKFTVHEFFYLMTKALYQLGNSNTDSIKAIYDVKGPSSEFDQSVYSAAVTKTNYLSIAKSLVTYISNNKQVPIYVEPVAGKLSYEIYVTLTARVLNFYNNNGELPTYVSYRSSGTPYLNITDESSDGNPYGLNGKKVWINADGGSDKIKWELANALKALGWDVYVSGTYANAHYEDYYNVYPGYVLINIYNGFCAGTMRELASSTIQSLLDAKHVVCVPVFHTEGWTNPDGMLPYRYGDFSGYSAQRAWDDDFSTIDPAIDNVEKFFKVNNIKYCASPTCQLILNQFLKGGYFASVS